MYFRLISLLCISLIVQSCVDNGGTDSTENSNLADDQSAALNEWFDKTWDDAVDRYPTWQTYLGIKKDYDQWSDESEEMSQKENEISKANLTYLEENFNSEQLDAQAELSYRLWKTDIEDDLENFEFRHHNYPVNQMRGTHSWIPSFLINMHRVTNEKDARDYLSRLSKVDYVIGQLIDNLKIREEKTIIPPKFVFPKVFESCRNVMSGAPFDDGAEAPILADFKKKLESLDGLSEETKSEMIAECEEHLVKVLKPAYESLLAYLIELEKKATDDVGVWKFPNGARFYEMRLKKMTTTDMSADEIFETGMNEVRRIHAEMRKIMTQVGFEHDENSDKDPLQQFFAYMEVDKQFYYDNTDEGRDAYLSKTHELIDAMHKELDGLFITKPKAELEVKRVEEFREKSAGKAFYQSPAPDGSRPGIYYVNLYDMNQMPNYQMEALAYHEAIPGHHMQLSIAQELEGLPKFRTLGGGYTAYAEGWGLYSEYVPKELGFYADPYSDFGRLAMELWRACRLVVDVGIHKKRWTREQGITFYRDNTPNPEEDCVKMVERHIVMPGQATAYKVGQLKILALRDMAKQQLGEQFDIREFHEQVLTFGAVPLNILEENVNNWIASKQN